MRVFNLPILIRWTKFQPGASFFIPCVDRREVERFVRSEAKRLRLDVVTKQVIEKGVYGLRVWRKEPTIDAHSASHI